jgi:uncharacterized membrane protein YdjX (TVP38/TMEM64 family)
LERQEDAHMPLWISRTRRRPLFLGLLLGVPIAGVALWLVARHGPAVWHILQDEEAIEAFVTQLGWFGPLAFVVINAMQIVIAPIPGYFVQMSAGFLYGPLWGGIWGTLGMLAGATAAMWLARRFGRPLVRRLVSEERMARWEKVTFSTNTLLWCLLLTGPTGDIPFYLAGLSRVRFVKILGILLVVRMPSVFISAAAGAGVTLLEWWHGVVIVAVFAVGAALVWRYRASFMRWFDSLIDRQAVATAEPAAKSREPAM